jgi:hypothetical protein
LRTFSTSPHRFAFYPSAPLRQPVLRTSSWLAPSFDHQPTLRSTGEEDARCVQPTSATQTKTCTRTSRVPDSLRSFRCVDPPRRLRLRRRRSGIRRFHVLRDRFGGPTCDADLDLNSSRTGESSVGVVFPRRTSDRASDTPVAIRRSSPAPRRASPALPASLSWPHARVFTGWCGSGDA